MKNKELKNVLSISFYKDLEDIYKKYKTIIVAFDFDNTIFDYHNKSIDYSVIINLLLDCQDLGFKLICFTSEINLKKLEFKKEFLKNIGLSKAVINEGDGIVMPINLPIDNMLKYVKPYANIYLDDKAGLREAFYRLQDLIINIKNKKI